MSLLLTRLGRGRATWDRRYNPSLVIDIARAGLADMVRGAALTYSRASAAWAFDSSGILRQYESGVPRIVPSPVGVMSVLSEPQSTNKCTNYNANPTDLSGVTKAGDASATLSVVSDAAALSAAGLSGVCSLGNVIKLDNSAGTTTAWVSINGNTGNTNDHTLSVFARGSGNLALRTGFTLPNGWGPYALTSQYVRYSASQSAGLAGGAKSSTDVMWVQATAGSIVYFVLNQWEEQAFVTSPIVVAGSQVTRARDELLVPASFAAGGAYSEWMDFVLQSQATTASALIGDDASVRNLGITSGLALQASNGAVGLATGNTYTLNARGRAAMAADSSGRAIVLNGSAVASDANTQTAIAQRRLGFITAGSDSQKGVLYLHGYRLFNTRLSNAALQALTS